MAKKLAFFLIAALILGLVHRAGAQKAEKLPRVGYIAQRNTPTATTPDPAVDAFQQGLRELGYIEGKNLLVDYRYAEGSEERLRSLVTELVQDNFDVLVIPPLPGIRAAKQATKTIPIVMITTADPVATGLIDSLARPGGNVTGVTRLTRELSGKRLELLKEAVPKVSRVGVFGNVDETNLKDAARGLKIQLHSVDLRGDKPDFAGAFQNAVKQRVNGLTTISGSFTLSHRNQIAALAIKNRLPSVHGRSEEVDAGGLMSYSAIDSESFRRAAYYVDKILKGAKPSDLPVEQPTKFEFVINLKTAKQIGVTIPQSVLFRADRVIK